jgi:hypothetical protein
VALVITDVSEERIASIIRVEGIGELGTTQLLVTLMLFLARLFGSLALVANHEPYNSRLEEGPAAGMSHMTHV